MILHIAALLGSMVIVNPDITGIEKKANVVYEKSLAKGTGIGVIGDKKFNLKDEEEVKKFAAITARFEAVPKGMEEAAHKLEEIKTDMTQEVLNGRMYFVIYFVDQNTATLPYEHPADHMKLYVSTDEQLAKTMNTPYPGVYGFNPQDKISYQFSLSNETPKEISNIVKLNLVGPLTYQNMEMYKDCGVPSVYCFVKPEDYETFHESFMPKAKECKNIAKFCVVPFSGENMHLSNYGLTPEDLPALLILKDGNKYPLKNALNNNVHEFVTNVQNGKSEPVFVSQDEPLDNDSLPVKVITRNNLQDFKDKSTKDRLLVFSSPNCGYCEKLKPEIEVLGETAKTYYDDALEVGICDVTVNDISDYDVSSVPKIFLLKANSNELRKFEGKERNAINICNFIKEEGHYNTDMSEQVPSNNDNKNTSEEDKEL